MSDPRGCVYLVGAGPGHPDLITIMGLNVLRRADVVAYDRLAPEQLLNEAPSDAERIFVGKASREHKYPQHEINELLIEQAKAGKVVVRLKGGDPFLYGRGFEELDACREAHVPCFVVPGVSSALAGPLAAGIPLTDRRHARSVAITSGYASTDPPGPEIDYGALARMDTVIIMMGWERLRVLTTGLIEAGKDSATPAACIASATRPQQQIVCGTLGTIADQAQRVGLAAPVLTVVGPVAKYALGGHQMTLPPS